MRIFSFQLSLIILGLALVSVTSAQAAPIVAGTTTFTISAVQDVELLPGTPFNPTGSSISIKDLTAFGTFSIARQAQVGTTIDFASGDAYFTASASPIGPFELGSGPSIGIGGYQGSITNVVQDPADPGFADGQATSLVSGDFSAEVFQFGLRVGGQLLFTKDAVIFTLLLDGLSPSYGSTFVSPDPVAVYWTNPGTGDDLLVGFSSNRRLVAVPEPTSLGILAAAGAVGLVITVGKRRRARLHQVRGLRRRA